MPVRAHKTSATRRLRQRAFTLIEILVVVVIVGIISAVALLAVGLVGDDRSLEREARRLASLIELATDEATIQGREFGVELLQNGYRFVEFDPLLDQWFEIVGDDFLRQRELAEGLEFELFVEERRVLLDIEARDTERDEDDRDLTDDYLPHVLIMSSGDVTPFELNIIRPADRSIVSMEMTPEGEIGLIEDEAS